MRGMENPHTSTSSTPTRWPSAARAQARFTVTLDLPTPPLPEATAITVVFPSVKNWGCSGRPPRRLVTRAPRSSSDIVPRTTWTCSTPDSGATAAVTSVSMRSRRGQPSMVSRTVTVTVASSMRMSFSMPTSSIGLPISGSMTFRSAARTSSVVGMGPSFGSGLVVAVHANGSARTLDDTARRPWGRRHNGRVMPPAHSPEIHKALADDTRFRLYRYVRLVARPVSVTEMSARLALHPTTIRPHLRRLEEAGLVTHEIRKGGSAGRPRTLYLVSEPADEESRDYRLLAEMLCGLVTGTRAMQKAR